MSVMSKYLKIVILSFLLLIVAPSIAHAQTADGGMVSFTFDDGFLSTYTNALPILSARGIPGTEFATTSWLDSETTGDGFPAINWQEVQALQNQYGWEIGSHTVTHPELTTLPIEQVDYELAQSKEELASHGINATSFASPYGAADDTVVGEVLKTYSAHRGFTDRFDTKDNSYNTSNTIIQSVEEGTTVADAQAWIDQAVAENKWLVLVFHNVALEYDSNYQWTTTNDVFSQIADYVKQAGIRTVTMSQAVQ